MSYFEGPYLRVLTPKTIDGYVPKTDSAGQIIYKESHLPLSAEKRLAKKNERRPEHLKHKIAIVNPYGDAKPIIIDGQAVDASELLGTKPMRGKRVTSVPSIDDLE